MSTVPLTDQLDDPSEDPLPRMITAAPAKNQTYAQILKSSAIVGGSTVVNVGIGIVRTKVMAMLLGPGGFGLFGLYGSIQTLTQSIAGMGINSSGVRQIAEAVGTGQRERIALTTAVLTKTSIVLGLLGGVLLLVFSRQVSSVTFGTPQRAAAVSLLSLAVFFSLLSGSQGALIQGMRRIGDLAKMNVLSAVWGVCTSIPLVYFFREKGLVPSLVSVAAMSILTSWWYSRKIDVLPVKVRFSQVREEASALLKLGSAFMVSGLITMGVAYFVRVMILHKVGFAATGLYQSAWAVGGLYVGFILQAMGADFYPRLTASISNHEECNRLVNEQALVGLLLAGPGVIGTLTFAPLVTTVLYSTHFAAAVPILRWICMGAMLQVVSWPMGFIIIAKGKQNLFIVSEVAWAAVNLCLTWACVTYFGVSGAGIAFFGSYAFHCFMSYAIVSRLSAFRWSKANIRNGGLYLILIATVLCGLYLLPLLPAAALGLAAAVLASLYSLRALSKLIPFDELPSSVQRFFITFRRSADPSLS
jgi:PST family polysaccharide transporter